MAEAKPLVGMRFKRTVPPFESVLQYLKEDTIDAKDRAYGYVRFLELVRLLGDGDATSQKICSDMRLFCSCIQRDIISSDENLASESLKVLGNILQRRNFVPYLPDDEACKFLLTLLALITTTSKKTICSLGLWVLAMQEMKTSVLASHSKMIVAVLLHGIDNPLGSIGATYESYEAIKRLSTQLPKEMRALSSTWAPAVYQNLLHCSAKRAELAESCLSATRSVLLPPIPQVSEVVVNDLQQKLLPRMEGMIKLDGRSPCIAVQAWGWLVQLLGLKSTENKSLMNRMLKLIETSFVNPSTQVRSACQVAWVSVIDVFVPSHREAGRDGSPASTAELSPREQLSLKRLNLLLLPLLNTMRWELDVTVLRGCCCTWIYLLCRLGQSVNEEHIFKAAVLPTLEAVFKNENNNRDEFVWQTCVDLLTDAISSEESHHNKSSKEGAFIQSPHTPAGISYAGVYSESHHKNISWSPWNLDRLDPFIQLLHQLWACGLQQPDVGKSEDGHPIPLNPNFEAARQCWTLLVTRVEAEGRNTVRPSNEHVTAVHLLLRFLCGICADVPSKTLLPLVWGLMEILIDSFGHDVVASSFYRISLQFTGHSDFLLQTHGECGPYSDASLPDMVTPVVYISAAWFKLVFENAAGGVDESVWLSVDKLISTGRSGFDIMGHFQGLAWILDHLASENHLHREQTPDVKKGPLGVSQGEQRLKSNDWHFLLEVWRIVGEKMRELVERSNDVAPVAGCRRDSGYQVVSDVLLFPIKSFLILSLRWNQSLKRESSSNSARGRNDTRVHASGTLEAELQTTEGGWLKLFDSVLRVSSLKSPQPNSFIGGFFQRVGQVMRSSLQEQTQLLPGGMERLKFDSSSLSIPCLKFLGNIVAHAMKHAEISNLAMLAISRKRRKTGFGASSVRVQCIAGMELEDANNLKDLLTVAGRLLTLSYEKCKHEKRQSSIHDSVVRVLGALTSLMQHITSQNDSVLLLQAIAQPLSYWFIVDSEASRPRTDGSSQARPLLPVAVLEGLAQAWDALLYCLQTCRPCLGFDSKLLLVQGPSLAAAFMHPHDAISNRTLAFWESTYGMKAAANLNYPPALVKVFTSLKQKVDISLPGWTTRPLAAAKEAQNVHDAPQRFYRPPHAKMRQYRDLMECLSKKNGAEKHARVVVREEDRQVASRGSEDMKLRPTEQLNTLELGQHAVDQQMANSSRSSDLMASTDVTAELQSTANDTMDTSPEEESQFLPTPEGNALIDELVSMECKAKLNPQEIFKSNTPDLQPALSDATVLPTDVPASAGPINESRHEGKLPDSQDSQDSQPIELPSMLEVANFLQKASEEQLNPKGRELNNNDNVQTRAMAKGIVAANKKPESGTVDLVTPPIALTDLPSAPPPPKLAGGAERPPGPTIGGQLPVTVAPSDGGSKGNLPRRRKKLKFQEDSQEMEYVVIPQTQRKKAGPLTTWQKEVRLSQRTGGMVVKTYTRADFSQSTACADESIDSQAPETTAMETILSKENIPPSNLPLSSHQLPPGPPTVKAEGLAGKVRDNDSSQADDPIQTPPLEEVDYTQLKTIPLEEVDYSQLKSKLANLIENDLTLTYRQIFESENYECLPRLIQARLGSQYNKLRKKVLEESTDAKNVDQFDSKGADQAHPQQVLGESPSHGKAIRPEDSSNPPQELDSEAHIPPSRSLRRKPEPHGGRRPAPSMLCVNLRSSGKLRGGKHWRINPELGKVITARLGIKKIVAKRQQLCSRKSRSTNSRCLVPKMVKRLLPPSSTADEPVVEAESTRSWGTRLRACRQRHVESESLHHPPQPHVKPLALSQEDSPITVPHSKEESKEVHKAPLEVTVQMQENSPFQVRNLNRGLLASSFGAASRIPDSSAQQESIQGASRSARSNSSQNPRKCRAPKRIPSLDSLSNAIPSQFRVADRSVSEEDDSTTTSGVGNESVSPMLSECSKVAPPSSFLQQEDEANGCSPTERPEPPLLFVCLREEGPSYQPTCGSGSGSGNNSNIPAHALEKNSQQEQTLPGSSREGGAGESMTKGDDEDFKTPPGSVLPEGFGADRHPSQSQTELDGSPRDHAEGNKPANEIQGLLEREDVQVSNVLSALLASSKWKTMKLAEASEVEKLLCQLKEAAACLTGDPSMFRTPRNP